MEQKLSQSQKYIIFHIAQKKEELKKLFDELLQTEQEQLQMIIKYYDLPTGAYSIKQLGDDVILFSEEAGFDSEKFQQEAAAAEILKPQNENIEPQSKE